jgi:rRNA maturation protein Nop10
MAILTLKDGKRYQERCPVCGGIHLYDQKTRGICSETERYLCPDCGHRTVAPLLELLGATVSSSLVSEADGSL